MNKIKISKRWKCSLSIFTIAAILLTGCGSSQVTQNDSAAAAQVELTTSTVNTSEIVVDKEFTTSDLDVGYEDSTATHITFDKSTIEVSGDGATNKDGVVTISDEGTYVFTGTLTDGQIVVDAEDADKVQIVLNGVSITCSDNAPIYIKNSDKTFITLEENTENTLIDGTEYVQTDENTVDAVIFSRSDLTINGDGTLNITGNYKHGIASKDDLVITGGTFNITAVKDAINGKDCVKIKDGTFTLSTTTGNGIQSKNGDDTTKGYVYICGGNITVSKCQEGIEGTVIIIDDGVINITAEDDGFNAASGNTTTTDSSTDTTTKDPSTDTTTKDPSTDTTTKDSSTDTTTKDSSTNTTTDGTNTKNTNNNANESATQLSTTTTTNETDANTDTSATTDSQDPGQGGFGGDGGNAFEVDTNAYISIAGGTITVDAGGDGIDSNGSLYVSGGTTYVSGPTNDGNGGLDYNGTADITGGTVIVAGSSGMAQGFSDSSSQYSILNNLTTACEAGTEIKLTDQDGNVIISYTPNKQYQSVVISTPDLTKDATYTLTCGDQTADLTLSSVVTSNGQQGMGGHGMGGHGNGDQGGKPADGFDPSDGGGKQPGQDGMGKPGDSTTTDGTTSDSTTTENNTTNSNTTDNNTTESN